MTRWPYSAFSGAWCITQFALFDFACPPRDEVEKRGGSSFGQTRKQRQVRDCHFALTSFHPVNSAQRKFQCLSDIFLAEPGVCVISRTGYHRGSGPVPAHPKFFNLVPQGKTPSVALTRGVHFAGKYNQCGLYTSKMAHLRQIWRVATVTIPRRREAGVRLKAALQKR